MASGKADSKGTVMAKPVQAAPEHWSKESLKDLEKTMHKAQFTHPKFTGGFNAQRNTEALRIIKDFDDKKEKEIDEDGTE